MKQFNYELYEFESILEDYSLGGRRYLLPDGSLVPSVTTVLSSLSKDSIEQWKKTIGEENANKITTQATTRGSAIHEIAEKYLKGDPDYDLGAMPINKMDFLGIKKELDEHVDTIFAIECPLYSYRLKTAGRTDLVATWDGVPAIIDFKTSRKIKKEEWIKSYFLQATCYSLMMQERTGLACPDIVIIMSVDHEGTFVYHKKRKPYIKEVVDLYTNFSG